MNTALHRTKNTIASAAAALALLPALAGDAGALDGAPAFIDYQGRLLNSQGGPFTSSGGPGTSGAAENFQVHFRIWDAQSGGALVWGEKQIVTVTGEGFFAVRLGEGEPIADSGDDSANHTGSVPHGAGALLDVFDGDERFLGVTVLVTGTTPGEIQPRLAFLSSPFAVVAQKAKTVATGAVGGNEIASGAITASHLAANSVSSASLANGAVGSPQLAAGSVVGAKLAANAVGNVAMADNAVGTAEVINNSLTAADLAADAVGASEIAAGAVGLSELDGAIGVWVKSGSNLTHETGRVGIGTSAPQRKVHVSGGASGNPLSTHADLVIEDDDNVTVQLNSPDDKSAGLNFGRLGSANSGSIRYDENERMDFTVNGDSRLTIDGSNGYIGIGKTSPKAILQLDTSGNNNDWDIILEDTDVTNTGNRRVGMRLSTQGFFEVTNSSVPANGGSGAGNFARLTSTGNWTAVSDRRLKCDIEGETGLLDAALALEPVRFRFKSQQDAAAPPELGLIAQDVEQALPTLVADDGHTKSVNYAGLSTVAIGAIQELKAEKDAEIAARDRKIAALEERLEALEAAIAPPAKR